MARFPGVTAIAARVGEWLHPATAHRRLSDAQSGIQTRAGLVGLIATATGAVAVLLAIAEVVVTGIEPVPGDEAFGLALIPAAVILVVVSVFAPQAIFRTRAAARTREVLTNPAAPMRPWNATVITFDAVLVGALLAGIYFDGVLALALFGLAFLARIVFQSTRHLLSDPNARFHSLMSAWNTGVTGAVAFLIVKPLIPSIDEAAPLWPLLFAALAAMYVGLTLNAMERWVNRERNPWAFARDAIDPRRIIVAVVSALIAWSVSFVGIRIDTLTMSAGAIAGTLAGLGIFVAAWLVLWYTSMRLWRRDALRTMALWSAHQAEVVGRLTDGSLNSELAARAAVRITSRMAISVFGATRAMVVVSEGHQDSTKELIGVDVYDNAPAPDARSLAVLPHLRMPLYPLPDHPSTSSVTIAGWLWPGWFLTRSHQIVQRFTDLATQALLVPILASDDSRVSAAFNDMFTTASRWPSLTAFEEAVSHMREQADASPQSNSLIVAVYAIDDFGALAGGKFEHVAVGQVMRLALGNPEFAGHDVFVAYEEPGRLWISLGGGPIIRNGVNLLRGMQQYINDHGSVPSAKLDVDVHVSVSFGYAAHQVDDFTLDGLLATARDRLAIDQASRDPFAVDALLTYDISPEDIIGSVDAPTSSTDVLSLLRADHGTQSEGGERRFALTFTPIHSLTSGAIRALSTAVSWQRTIGSVDASQIDAFRAMISRQVELAGAGARVILGEVKALLEESREVGQSDLPVIAWMPSVLLTADAGQEALPNLVTPFLNRAECARTVVLLDTIPLGSGQALRLLHDRGVKIAVTAGAAVAADPSDLYGWQRWAILFPQHVAQGSSGVDALTIQQTASAIANQDTRLIAVADSSVDAHELTANNVTWAMDPRESVTVTGTSTIRDGLLG